jgi:N-formylglutamate amidohydrolase
VPTRRLILILAFAAALAELPAPGAPEDLVRSQAGDLPILLTAPHGGTQPIPGVTPRDAGVRVRDEETDVIATGVATRLEELLKARPYLVAARFHRRFCDVNRAPADAFQEEAARPVYEAYHHAVRSDVDAIRKGWPKAGLLVDIHGQAKDPDLIYRGARDGLTVKHALRELGEESLVGSDSVFGGLKRAGFGIFPETAPPEPKESRSFDGGYTVATYGSSQKDGIDAIQTEIGSGPGAPGEANPGAGRRHRGVCPEVPRR